MGDQVLYCHIVNHDMIVYCTPWQFITLRPDDHIHAMKIVYFGPKWSYHCNTDATTSPNPTTLVTSSQTSQRTLTERSLAHHTSTSFSTSTTSSTMTASQIVTVPTVSVTTKKTTAEPNVLCDHSFVNGGWDCSNGSKPGSLCVRFYNDNAFESKRCLCNSNDSRHPYYDCSYPNWFIHMFTINTCSLLWGSAVLFMSTTCSRLKMLNFTFTYVLSWNKRFPWTTETKLVFLNVVNNVSINKFFCQIYPVFKDATKFQSVRRSDSDETQDM